MQTSLQPQPQIELIYRVPDVCKAVGVKKSKLYRLIQCGLFPKPIKAFNSSSSIWPGREIGIMVDAVISQASEEEIKEIVAEIQSKREGTLVTQ